MNLSIPAEHQGRVTLPPRVTGALRDRWVPGPDWARDPVGWVQEHLEGTWLWSKQREIMEAVRDHSQVAVQSAHSTGKSFIAATVVLWWILSHPPGEAFVVTSAPTGDQVKAILWREINRGWKRGGFEATRGGRLNLTDWYDASGELVGFGRKPNDYEPTAFQGIHARFVLVVLDEACGMPETLWDAASSLASNENGRILAIGNPDDPQSHFANVCKRETWHRIKISAFDTPNFTGEEVPDLVKEMLVADRWVREKAEEWGESSPVYTSKVLGEFPTDAEDGVIPYSWVLRAQKTEHTPYGDVEAGFDVSGGGKDRAVAWVRQGPRAICKYTWKGVTDPLELAQKFYDQIIIVHRPTCVKIDANGVGWGIGGILDSWHQDGKHDCVAVPVNTSESADDDEHFLNLRAELWWSMRELVRQSEVDLSALDDDDVAELTVVKYHTQNPRGRIQVEKKDEIRKRLSKGRDQLGTSPDSADALLLAFHTAVWEMEDWTEAVTAARMS